MNLPIRYFSILAILLLSGLFINSVSNKQNNINTAESYIIKGLKVPQNLNFAGEKAPIHLPDIYERFDKELHIITYWQSNTLLQLKRTEKYFPIIEPILKQYGIPDDFKYLAVAESGLQNVVSPSDARGFWQLLKGTAIENGLEVNENVDERYDVEKSTHAACKYLLKSKEKFGSWTLAAASYNAGNTGIGRRVEEQQVTNYYDLLVVDETARYIPRIIVFKEIFSNPAKYGFQLESDDFYQPIKFKIVEVENEIPDLIQFAIDNKINYKLLRIYNPWLRENNLKNKSNKKYLIKIPV
ncbi:MAG: lytic transglycosylase domain-containing protein [Flavobacteriaceae bacterium]|nr:lytic transglycosylase domain-containing protein [Flavobacteriaceae bacterium]